MWGYAVIVGGGYNIISKYAGMARGNFQRCSQAEFTAVVVEAQIKTFLVRHKF